VAVPASLEAKKFNAWLRAGFTGCIFAQHMAKAGGDTLAFSTLSSLDSDDLDLLEVFIDDAEVLQSVAVVVFPRLRSHDHVVDLLLALRARPRWSVFAKDYPQACAGCSAIELGWDTAGGLASTVMGFGPFGELPVTRRSPYVSLALWSGGRANPFFSRGPKGRVNMAHARHALGEEQHDATWSKTEQEVAALFADPVEDAQALHSISFCIPSSSAARLSA
jgi:hypothetical protein